MAAEIHGGNPSHMNPRGTMALSFRQVSEFVPPVFALSQCSRESSFEGLAGRPWLGEDWLVVSDLSYFQPVMAN